MKRYSIGIDVGPTNTEIGLFDENMELIAIEQELTDPEANLDRLLDFTVSLVRNILRDNGASMAELKGVGTALPCYIDYSEGVVREGNYIMALTNAPIRDLLQDRLQLPVVIENDAEFLRGALEQEQLISGIEDQYGLYVLTVNGVTADESKQQWWCFTKGGEQIFTGVDATPIADGDTFEATLMTGW